MEQISVEWKTKYKNRPAMMDELKKIVMDDTNFNQLIFVMKKTRFSET
ncbi:MAG: hypothetical protein ACLRWA_06160 [Lachnospira sp.]